MKGLLAAFLLAAVAAPAAVAQTPAVNQAYAGGQIGERFDGFIGVVSPSISATVRSQVGAINIRRRKLYNDLAIGKRVSPEEVGITAGCRLLREVRVGEAYLLADGVWRRRGAGQPVQMPEYCR